MRGRLAILALGVLVVLSLIAGGAASADPCVPPLNLC
jgi:hypothetical protein